MDFVESCVNEKGFIVPEFIMKHKYNDIMIKGADFYAFYNEAEGLWNTDPNKLVNIIDAQLREDMSKMNARGAKYLRNFSSGQYVNFQKFCKAIKDRYIPLDRSIIFENTELKRENYASKKLTYAMVDGPHESYDRLMNVLYAPEERQKIEWGIGSIIAGDSKHIQKFFVLFGPPGSGKSTVLNLIELMFDGYSANFSAEELANANSSFSLEPFRDNPLVAIDQDGDLSRISTNTRLNMIVSHDKLVVNEKFKSTYASRMDSMLWIATNSPVKITDSKSGLIRRLIDVYPTGDKVPVREYNKLTKGLKFELGAIAKHCLDIYNELGESYYDEYKPLKMLKVTNDIFDFLSDKYDDFANEPYVKITYLWEEFKKWMEYNNVPATSCNYRKFRNDILGYFDNFDERIRMEDGTIQYSVLSGFKKKMFGEEKEVTQTVVPDDIFEDMPEWLQLKRQESKLDAYEAESPAQYCNDDGNPRKKWENVSTKLANLDTSKLHYVKPIDEHHIFVDFDCYKNGKKDLATNLREAVQFPKTYAEVSKGGEGLHLHYIYDGDINKLSAIFGPNIEVKVFPNNKGSAMRRRLSLCNDCDISHISSGLPLKEVKQEMIDSEVAYNERALQTIVMRCMKKEYAPHATVTSVQFAKKILNEAYAKGTKYDLSPMKNTMLYFAQQSTNHAEECVRMVEETHWCSKEYEEIFVQPDILKHDPPATNQEDKYEDDTPLVFYDVEVFPNLFVICWKYRGSSEIVRMINPTPEEVRMLFKLKLVGFNVRDYDNHILYGRAMGYTNSQLFRLSRSIINGDKSEKKNNKFGNAYELSYTDIYDFSNTKQSLKKWEIELGIHHLELGLAWDEPVPRELWDKVAEYCCNDVVATEALFDHLEDTDWTSRIILSELSGLSRNETTNNHTMQIIFGDDKNPQREFVYTNLADIFPGYEFNQYAERDKRSVYKGIYTKEGGYVNALHGYWENVALLDVASMHPHSAKVLNIFGDRYTKRYYNLVETRLHIKHKEEDKARAMFEGRIGEIVDKYDLSLKKLSNALKIPINAVYGLTSAGFPNRARDPRNVDNIVAKYGALFMVNLNEEVAKRGFKVCHTKTDSIKIPNATKEIIDFVMEYGRKYGYTFEHEATYEKMCLVNNAVYIAKYADKDWCQEQYGYIPDKCNDHAGEWTATGKQFAVPYVFKSLFSHEEIIFSDCCEAKEVKSPAALYLRKGEEDQYIGRIGLFTPVSDEVGCELVRIDGDKVGAATGCKGYKWLESEYVKENGLEDKIDISYYGKLVDDAKEAINEYVDFDKFAA